MDSLAHLPTRDGDAYRAVIEATAGSRNKLKYSAALGAFELHHVLPAGMAFPHAFGFLPSTLGADGDPLDVLVLMDEPAPAGTVVRCRLIGVIEAEQGRAGEKRVRNDRLLAVASQSHQYARLRDLADLEPGLVDELESFFVHYNQRRGITFEPLARKGVQAAAALVSQGEAHRAPGQSPKPPAPVDQVPPGTPGSGENVCPRCGGSGKLDGGVCPACQGTGKVTTGIGGG